MKDNKIFVEGLMPDVLCRHHFIKHKHLFDNSFVLDIGCATGFFLSKFEKGVGVDLSKENLRLAKKLNPMKSFVQAEASMLPFKTSTFDFVLSLEVVEHTKKPIVMFKEVNRCLDSKGKYLISFDIPSYTRIFVSTVASKVIVERHLWHKKSDLSDSKFFTLLNEEKSVAVLNAIFSVICIWKIRGLLMNLLVALSVAVERLTRPKNLVRKGISFQYSRLNTPFIKAYIKFIKPLVNVVARTDVGKFDNSCVVVLVRKRD